MSIAGLDFAILRRLVLKDWYLHRGIILFTLALDVFIFYITRVTASPLHRYSDFPEVSADSLAYYAMTISGWQFFFSHLNVIFVTCRERKEQTLGFVMSLPISPREFRAAKLLANLLLYLLPWTGLLATVLFFVLRRENLPDGLWPFVAIAFAAGLAGYCLCLGILVIEEDRFWPLLAGIVAGAFLPYALLTWVASLAPIQAAAVADSAAFTPLSAGLLALCAATIAATLAVVVYRPWRQSDFA